ncbi:MAG: ATP-dependent protease ATPase subunit HslU [Deltaproteobacteria bacterium]|jgi:ATP-dependent HslUV protease ATP-binding subunit HslU|nr:ATP-dependent protease ATPase subunit HslU [Deltaproteobacteria bacterium]
MTTANSKNPTTPSTSTSSEREYVLSLTPKAIVAELDRYIIGQGQAKRSVAIALRNRWRRLQAPADMVDEITPKNILMIGPTGVGKTEIARRLAKLTNSPFIKVEASKFTEIGYVGRDVESIIRDLMDLSVDMVKTEERERVAAKAAEIAEERVLDLLLPTPKGSEHKNSSDGAADGKWAPTKSTRNKLRNMLRNGQLKDHLITLETEESRSPNAPRLFASIGFEEMDKNLSEAMSSLLPKKTTVRKMDPYSAMKIIEAEEANKLVDNDSVITEAKKRVEQRGLVFIDEIDKVTQNDHESRSGPDISREGVQRDLLPIVEGTTVPTRHGTIKTDHILFIAAGAFHMSKPSDLMPEFQGRFPIRVELNSLSKQDFVRILTEPTNALIKQYETLLAAEEIELEFTFQSIEELAEMAWEVNDKHENIGARRLATIMEKLLEEISFDAPDISPAKVTITPEMVKEKLSDVVKSQDLSKFIL